jgi:hypothetical protein
MGLHNGPDEALKAPIDPLRFVIGPPKSPNRAPMGPLRILMAPDDGPDGTPKGPNGPRKALMGVHDLPLNGPNAAPKGPHRGLFAGWVEGGPLVFCFFFLSLPIRPCSVLLSSLGPPGTE